MTSPACGSSSPLLSSAHCEAEMPRNDPVRTLQHRERQSDPLRDGSRVKQPQEDEREV